MAKLSKIAQAKRKPKFAVRQWLKDPAERDLARAREMVETCFSSADHKEGRSAFMEKRKPNFTGR